MRLLALIAVFIGLAIDNAAAFRVQSRGFLGPFKSKAKPTPVPGGMELVRRQRGWIPFKKRPSEPGTLENCEQVKFLLEGMQSLEVDPGIAKVFGSNIPAKLSSIAGALKHVDHDIAKKTCTQNTVNAVMQLTRPLAEEVIKLDSIFFVVGWLKAKLKSWADVSATTIVDKYLGSFFKRLSSAYVATKAIKNCEIPQDKAVATFKGLHRGAGSKKVLEEIVAAESQFVGGDYNLSPLDKFILKTNVCAQLPEGAKKPFILPPLQTAPAAGAEEAARG